jgi:hypothetical protein
MDDSTDERRIGNDFGGIACGPIEVLSRDFPLWPEENHEQF